MKMRLIENKFYDTTKDVQGMKYMIFHGWFLVETLKKRHLFHFVLGDDKAIRPSKCSFPFPYLTTAVCKYFPLLKIINKNYVFFRF